MDYDFREIEQKWRRFWAENKTFKAVEDPQKQKYYVLDMFPYPSGAGLHVGHPLGYIASDILSRFKRQQGFSVLHPMGYDSFGLPAEQYAIETGQHPAKTTEVNTARYRGQMDLLGFSFDWDREVRTSSPDYYRWTQWIFSRLFDSWYDTQLDHARPISELYSLFEQGGSHYAHACHHSDRTFTADEWKQFSDEEKYETSLAYRLAFLAESWVNWCPALGTVLANDEVKDGVSERGGHPVEQKRMLQWELRITAYADRLLEGLERIDWSDSIKEQQRNWIGRSEGAAVHFPVEGPEHNIEVFTTRPDTIHGVSFMVLAPEHPLVNGITTQEHRRAVSDYQKKAAAKSERDRQADVKNITGEFTGAYATHPVTGDRIPVWIGDYVLAGYGTGAVMAVPAGDQRDWDFANHFGIEIPSIFEGHDISQGANEDKNAVLCNSGDLNGMKGKQGIAKMIEKLEELGVGQGRVNFRLRDAVFSRQRYWGEPFPIYYKGDVPHLVPDEHLPLELPDVDKYLPTADGEPPLARATDWTLATVTGKKEDEQYRLEYNTMPGWAGSSWYFLRYTDAQNQEEFASKAKRDYWGNVDFYVGGSEHATGHLLYSRFWTKFLYDLKFCDFDEPFQKMVNQGMILGRSSLIHRLNFTIEWNEESEVPFNKDQAGKEIVDAFPPHFVSQGYATMDTNPSTGSESEKVREFIGGVEDELRELVNSKFPEYAPHFQAVSFFYSMLHVDISLVDTDLLRISDFREWREEYKNAEFTVEEDGTFVCEHEVEKMSKSKFNVQTPDDLVEKYGADTLRMYEMFLGPIEQSKPWDVQGITGVNNFLRKLWKLCHGADNEWKVASIDPSKEELRALHKCIKKVTEDIERFSLNTVVSEMMILVNELTRLTTLSSQIIDPVVRMLAPFAPHIAEELWVKLGHAEGSVSTSPWPEFKQEYLELDAFDYPVSFNGKTRFRLELPTDLTPAEVEQEVLSHADAQKWLEGKTPKKVIVVPKRIVNVVI